MPKPREHNEWFRTVSKTKCACGQRNTTVWSWGNYVYGKWRTITHFCDACIDRAVFPHLVPHANECGCVINLIGYSGQRLSAKLQALQQQLNQTFCAVQQKRAA